MKKIFYNVGRVFTLAFITTIFTMAPSAQASTWTLTDGLWPTGITNWSCWISDPNGSRGWNFCRYHKGSSDPYDRLIYLSDYYYLNVVTGWSDVGRPVSISPFHPPYSFLPTIWCKAQMTVLPEGINPTDAHLEVIDAASWTYVTTQRKVYPRSAVRSVISTPSWVPNAKEIFVRLGIVGSGYQSSISINDLTVSCTY